MEVIIGIVIVYIVAKIIRNVTYNSLKAEVLKELGFSHWNVVSHFDECVTVKSRQTLEKYDDIHKIAENKSETKTDKVAIICLDQDDTINVAQLLTEYYKDNKIMLIGFGNNETCRLYLSKKVISELIYLNPVKIGETDLKELFEYRTKGYSNSYVTVATQIIKSRW